MGNTNATGEVTTVSLDEQMELRDKLPEDLRELVSAAPAAVDLRVIWAIWKRFGEKARGEIEAVFDVEFPGWRVPEKPPSQWAKLRKGRVIHKQLERLR